MLGGSSSNMTSGLQQDQSLDKAFEYVWNRKGPGIPALHAAKSVFPAVNRPMWSTPVRHFPDSMPHEESAHVYQSLQRHRTTGTFKMVQPIASFGSKMSGTVCDICTFKWWRISNCGVHSICDKYLWKSGKPQWASWFWFSHTHSDLKMTFELHFLQGHCSWIAINHRGTTSWSKMLEIISPPHNFS